MTLADLPTLRYFQVDHSQGKVVVARARLKGLQSEAKGWRLKTEVGV